MNKHLRAALVGLVMALALVGATAHPAHAATAVTAETYSALGDSYASGVGSGTPINSSGQTLQAYPVLLAGGLSNVNFLAVSGATTTDLSYQIAQVPSTSKQVTLTIGGNDLNFVNDAADCISDASTCSSLLNTSQYSLSTLTSSISTAIDKIQAKAPRATIYVTGYPLLFQAKQTSYNGGTCAVGTVNGYPLIITEWQADQMDSAARSLDSAVRAATVGQRKTTYVDVTAAFTGHGLCGPLWSGQTNPNSYIQPVHATVTTSGWSVDRSNGPLHPTAAGQQAYAATIINAGFDGAPSAS